MSERRLADIARIGVLQPKVFRAMLLERALEDEDAFFQRDPDYPDLCCAIVNSELHISWSLGTIGCSRKQAKDSAFCAHHEYWNVILGARDPDDYIFGAAA